MFTLRHEFRVVSGSQNAPADRGCCGEDVEANSRWEQSTQAHLSEDIRFEWALLTQHNRHQTFEPFPIRNIPCDD